MLLRYCPPQYICYLAWYVYNCARYYDASARSLTICELRLRNVHEEVGVLCGGKNTNRKRWCSK